VSATHRATDVVLVLSRRRPDPGRTDPDVADPAIQTIHIHNQMKSTSSIF
jgi:hypothetical protein